MVINFCLVFDFINCIGYKRYDQRKMRFFAVTVFFLNKFHIIIPLGDPVTVSHMELSGLARGGEVVTQGAPNACKTKNCWRI